VNAGKEIDRSFGMSDLARVFMSEFDENA